MIDKLKSVFGGFRKDEDGTTVVEYAVCLLIVSAVGVGAMTLLSTNVTTQVGDAATLLGIVAAAP